MPFESQLHELFKICQHCGSLIDTTTQINQGSMVTIATNGLNGHSVSWQSQPLIEGTAAGKICQHCGSLIDTTTQINQGSMVTIATNGLNGHSVSWQSQPLIEGTAAGKILIPAAILFSGNTYKRTVDFAKYLNLQFVSSSHYYTTQATIIFPVVQHTWITSQNALVKKLKQSDSVDVCGDGRCDSPGYSAKLWHIYPDG